MAKSGCGGTRRRSTCSRTRPTFTVAAADRAVVHDFAGTPTPFLSCSDVAVFKAFFNRSKDWVDIETMIEAHTLDVDLTLGVLVRYLAVDDERVLRLRSLVR